MADPMDQADFSAVPLFPLPNVVLFPRAVLPLHIFEERYKAMFADALGCRRQIAMALLAPGWERNYHGKAAIDRVVCIGDILSHERLPDGRYNFLIQGRTRARIVRELDHQPYRIAALTALVERKVMEIDLAAERRRLVAAFAEDRLASTGMGRRFRDLLGGPVPTSDIADLVAFNFLEDISLKQSLLAECDVRARVHRIVDAFESFHSLVKSIASADFCHNPSLN